MQLSARQYDSITSLFCEDCVKSIGSVSEAKEGKGWFFQAYGSKSKAGFAATKNEALSAVVANHEKDHGGE